MANSSLSLQEYNSRGKSTNSSFPGLLWGIFPGFYQGAFELFVDF